MILRRIYIILAKQLDKPVIRTGMTSWPCSLGLTLKRAQQPAAPRSRSYRCRDFSPFDLARPFTDKSRCVHWHQQWPSSSRTACPSSCHL